MFHSRSSNGCGSTVALRSKQIRQIVERAKASKFKRDNKNRPMEVSSKRPVPRLREVVPGVKR